MPIWFWLNIPAAALFVLLTVGIPMWMLLKGRSIEEKVL